MTATEKANSQETGLTKNSFNWRIVFTAGMGFFTDAYDLFVIGVVTALLTPLWHLTVTQLAILNGASLISAAVGAVIFGYMADKLGRKKIYGIEVLILFFGAILSASSNTFMGLLIARIIVGFGIGGDYPTSAVVASEGAHTKNRGFLVLLVFAMQAVGLVFGPLFASLLIYLQLPQNYIWRILLGFGALPAASVFYLRRQISESSKFLEHKKAPLEVSRVVSDLVGYKKEKSLTFKIKSKLWDKKHLKYLLGTAGAWFILDVAFYGNGISSLFIIKNLFHSTTLLKSTLSSVLLFLLFAVPGYYFAAKYVDSIGRKRLQHIGFAMIAVCYAVIALVPAVMSHIVWFIIVFGLSFFFVNFGPNTTTFLIPSEIFPTKIRATGHGTSAAFGKVGAFVGALFLPLILNSQGMTFTFIIMAGISLLGILTTLLVPEMKGVSLE